jgi:hypothetical protein
MQSFDILGVLLWIRRADDPFFSPLHQSPRIAPSLPAAARRLGKLCNLPGLHKDGKPCAPGRRRRA